MYAITFQNGVLEPVKVPLGKAKTSAFLKTPISGWNLVAISHVWADGLGNPHANKLPSCQLARLQQGVNDLYSPKQHPVPFWIDPLMIPVTHNTKNEVEREAAKRKKVEALRDMEWVYKGASKVLVLDHGLRSTVTEGMACEEIGARLMCSVWSRRLWTLQEGCVKHRTFFQFADRVTCWPDLHNEVLQRAKLSNWQKNSVLDKNHPVRQAQKLDWYQTRDKSSSWGFTGYSVSSNAAYPRLSAMFDKSLYQSLYPVWHSIVKFLEDMSLEWSGDLKGEALAHCMRGMFYRNCSKPEDEALVLASTLSKGAGSAAKYTRAAATPEDRYRLLFQDLNKVPREILFVDQKRYLQPGCGWIPKSLLSVNAATAKPMNRRDQLSTWSKWIIRMNRKFSELCIPTPHGLEIGLDGVRLMPQPSTFSAPFCFSSGDAHWIVHLRRSGTGEDVHLLEQAEWVLIPDVDFATGTRQCRAVVVKVEEWYSHKKGAKTTFKALATLTRTALDEPITSALPRLVVEYPKRPRDWTNMTKEQAGNMKVPVATAMSDLYLHNEKWTVG